MLPVCCSLGLFLWGTALAAGEPCDRNPALETWLTARTMEWARLLTQLPGYEPPSPLQVCQAAGKAPHTDGLHIYLPPLAEEEERLSLAHEYVHLALRHHPVAHDERYVEQVARSLILGEQLP
ncbi:MAG: DUF2300 domain-containing protein [Magnetococcales bacterium]|nr:DUF2300 domain-containing protein [Magnetococcales bacterium]